MNITLPPAHQVKSKILAAIKARKLQCQQEGFIPHVTSCMYSGPCVVGILLTEEERAYLDQRDKSTTISALIDAQVVKLTDPGDRWFYPRIQRSHDSGDVSDIRDLCGG